MTIAEIDFKPLRNYSVIFKMYIWLKRARMILLRVAILGFVLYIFYSGGVSYSSSSDFSIGWLIVLWMATNYLLTYSMSVPWQKFAKINRLLVSSNKGMSNDYLHTKVPSFKGKLLALSFAPIKGNLDNYDFWFFTRIYKEGGILRWRERKMDTIIKISIDNVSMPSIVINATRNEKARRSNLTKKYEDSWKFQFEGVQGAHYDVYTKPKNRVLALQLFTPDVISVLFEKMPYMDLEVRGNGIWFVQRYGVLDDQLAESIFSAVSDFMPEFRKQLLSARLLQ